MIENRIPITGKTITESAHEIGAEVRICNTLCELEFEVIMGEAETIGEALAQIIEQGKFIKKQDKSEDTIQWKYAGDL